jgi:endonuclease-3 related protein
MRRRSPSKKSAADTRRGASIRTLFRTLESAFGPQHWWPAESAFEVVLGAYLTQNTAWTNVERAIANLRAAGIVSLDGVREVPIDELERLLRPAGYFRQKASRIKHFVAHLDARHGGSLEAMLTTPVAELRAELLALHGVGPETADSILLYAASREVFVVDAYTRRIFQRHRLISAADGYEQIRASVERALPLECEPLPAPAAARRAGAAPRTATLTRAPSTEAPTPQAHAPSPASTLARSEIARRYNEFHALLVQTGKHFCRKAAPLCEHCPLAPLLPPGAKPR